MKNATILIAMSTGLAVCPTSQAAREKVIVCMPGDVGPEVRIAQAISSDIFTQIGVAIGWKYNATCTADGLMISLTQKTPANLLPGAFAYARPYEGAQIVVLYDRVRRQTDAALLPYVLAYVFTHEIAHILQGISRHSDSGIMKCRWRHDDYAQMRQRQLAFDAADVELIHIGLKVRKGKELPMTVAEAR